MNNKGQFSIIAALLVAIILIATVVVTYSTIRNSSTLDQPQVLSAIDETNFAIKQILGFTVGYYGSVLKVTGNSSYAKMLATNYLHSGLVNIANMRPEWGTSFNVSNIDMRTFWFTNTSYSTGNLAVNYSLTGLGIYGMMYEASCVLSVKVEETVSGNQTKLMVTKDGNESLVNLGKQNFKFFRYDYASSTWELTSPSTEPVAFANGTYLIDIPSDVDPYSYVIQVEDSRGIIVVASSFSRYACTLTWNSTLYASLGVTNRTLINQESFEGSWPPSQPSSWTETGNWNKESNQKYGSGTYSADFDGSSSGVSGDLTTCDLSCVDTSGAIYVDFWYRDEGLDSGEFMLCYYDGTSWDTIVDLGTGLENQWLHYQQTITDIQYFKSNFRIQWSAVDVEDGEHAYVDYVTVKKEVNLSMEGATIVVELLQNGTMRWLGQNLQLTTQAKPIPPIPTKAIHVNQTIEGTNREVPFQIEDWASDYKIPLGLTNNASVFSSRTMLVFLVNSKASKVVIWWNGSDTAIQTSYAYVNQHFTVDTVQRTLTNGILDLTIDFSQRSGVYSFKVVSTIGVSTSTAEFIRINNKVADYGNSEPAYAITEGTVRVIIHHEVEWDDGITSPLCPNVYAHIVLTLPANATYYTYQLHFMFVSTQKSRTITDLCPIKLMASTGTPQTENGTSSGYPIVSNTTSLFYNFSASTWKHHWSQLVSGAKGTGIMFTDSSNQQLYVFDAIASSKTGGIRADGTNRAIDLLPVSSMAQVQFQYALDVMWYGAVVTFDSTTPIYEVVNGQKTGLWITVEHPPTITVATEN
ncbi:hypothetical protein HXY33_01895 [Candidatus Bathyarchaeota archaeon]|nr:hypothetical protein [Candidatus Bathyarchaeota archaeon]